jgi:hypothetical protein
MSHPISLSDEQLSVITDFAEPLAPHDRSAFLAALANLLRHEPRPIGDGALHRAAKQLLAAGHYQRQSIRDVTSYRSGDEVGMDRVNRYLADGDVAVASLAAGLKSISGAASG